MARRTRKLLDSYPEMSNLSPCVFPSRTKQDRHVLEGALMHHVEEAENAKWSQCLRYFTNLAFLMGNQYATFLWNTNTNTLSYAETSAKLSLPGGIETAIPRTVDNRLIKPYQMAISLLNEIRPEPRIKPKSSSPEDEDAAAIGAIVHDLKYEDMGMPIHLRRAASYMAIMGTVIGETYWGDTHEPIVEPVYSPVMKREDLLGHEYESREVTGEQFGFRKDVRHRIWGPFHFQQDAEATESPDSLSWCYRQQFMDIGLIIDLFDRPGPGFFRDSIERIREDMGIQYPLYWWERIRDIIETPEGWTQFSARLGSVGSGSAPNQTILRTWHCKPNRYYPRGRTLVQAGHALLYAGDSDVWDERYPWRWHPYSFCRWWTMPGRFLGIPLLSQLLTLQKKINAIDSLTQLGREFGTVGQWLVPKQAHVPDGDLSGIPGQHIHYTATATGAKPEKVKHEGLPPEYFAERDQALVSIEQIGGTESFLAAKAPSALRAGVMLDVLQKRERQSQSPILQDFDQYLQTISQGILIETALHMTDEDPVFTERIIARARDSRSHIAVTTFAGTDLRDNVNVAVDVASALLRSPEAKQQRALEALNSIGAAMSPADRAKMLAVIGLDEFATQETSDYRRAKRMVSVVVQGQVDAMEVWAGVDDPQVFRDVLKVEIQSDRMVTYDQAVQQKLISLYLQYDQLFQQLQQQQLQQMMLLQGGKSNPTRRQAA